MIIIRQVLGKKTYFKCVQIECLIMEKIRIIEKQFKVYKKMKDNINNKENVRML